MENTDLKGVSVQAKGAVEVGDDKKIDDESPQMKALRQQVQKLMSLQYKNGGGKGAGKNAKSVQQASTSKGPAINASGPFTDGKPPIQCYNCWGWGHVKRECPSPLNLMKGETKKAPPSGKGVQNSQNPTNPNSTPSPQGSAQ